MTLKLGFIGSGGIAEHHLKNLVQMDGVKIAAFYDVNAERALQAAAKHNDAKAFAQLDDMLDAGKLDAVYVCVPPMGHGDAERKLVERGIPFLVEKPLGLDRSIPAEIAAAVATSGLLTSVGYHWRYSEATATAKRLLQERITGMALGYWMGGMPMVPWWRVQAGSGGQFVEQTTHIVDLLRYLCGEVREVYAAYALRVMGDKVEGTDVPDVGSVTMKLADGTIATISNTCMMTSGFQVGLDLYTNKGLLEIRGDQLRDIGADGTETHVNSANPYYTEDEIFIDALRTGDRSRILSDYADALRTHEVTVAANESAVSGQPVALS